MKYLVGSILCLSFLGLGYFLGENKSQNGAPQVLQEVESVATTESTEEELLKEVLDQGGAVATTRKSKLSRKQKKEKLEKRLKYLIEKAPYSIVKKVYQNRERELDKAAFGDYEKADYTNKEKAKDFEKELLTTILPAIKRSYQYRAEGNLEFKGHSIPYSIAVSLSNPWPGSKQKKSVPKDPKDFSYMMLIHFDTSGVGFGDDKFTTGSGAGMFSLVRESGRVFLKESIFYGDKDTIFNDILYILVEAPARDGEFGALRLFDSSTSKWSEVSDQLSWRPITEEAFKKANRDLWGRDPS
jgi:hypothetical protein